jgi:hypothetical protein
VRDFFRHVRLFSALGNLYFNAGQNEIERYKKKHVESAVASGACAADWMARRGRNFDAA